MVEKKNQTTVSEIPKIISVVRLNGRFQNSGHICTCARMYHREKIPLQSTREKILESSLGGLGGNLSSPV